jgi:hypothetical protein
MVLDYRPNVAREFQPGELPYNRSIVCGAVQLMEVITQWIRTEPLKYGDMAVAAGVVGRAESDKVLFRLVVLVLAPVTKTPSGDMGGGTGPETELYSLLVALPRVVRERTIQL